MNLDPIAISVARRFLRAVHGNAPIAHSDAGHIDAMAGRKATGDDLARLLDRLRSVRLVCCCGREPRGPSNESLRRSR
jgi:hypothetical protein